VGGDELKKMREGRGGDIKECPCIKSKEITHVERKEYGNVKGRESKQGGTKQEQKTLGEVYR